MAREIFADVEGFWPSFSSTTPFLYASSFSYLFVLTAKLHLGVGRESHSTYVEGPLVGSLLLGAVVSPVSQLLDFLVFPVESYANGLRTIILKTPASKDQV